MSLLTVKAVDTLYCYCMPNDDNSTPLRSQLNTWETDCNFEQPRYPSDSICSLSFTPVSRTIDSTDLPTRSTSSSRHWGRSAAGGPRLASLQLLLPPNGGSIACRLPSRDLKVAATDTPSRAVRPVQLSGDCLSVLSP